MSGSSDAAFQRFAIEKGKVIAAMKKLQSFPRDSAERALVWSGFLQATKNSVAALVRSGMLNPNTKEVAQKIKNWENSDPVFKYLLHVRNAEAHAEEHNDALPTPVRPQTIAFGGGAVVIQGSGSITMNGTTLNGKPMPDGVYSLRDDGLISAPSLVSEIHYSPMQIELKPVKDQNGKTYVFPFESVPNAELPEVFCARHVADRLAIWESELSSALRA